MSIVSWNIICLWNPSSRTWHLCQWLSLMGPIWATISTIATRCAAPARQVPGPGSEGLRGAEAWSAASWSGCVGAQLVSSRRPANTQSSVLPVSVRCSGGRGSWGHVTRGAWWGTWRDRGPPWYCSGTCCCTWPPSTPRPKVDIRYYLNMHRHRHIKLSRIE